MIVECHMIFVENLAENSDKNFSENFIDFYFNLVTENCCDSTDQNFYCIVKFYFFF